MVIRPNANGIRALAMARDSSRWVLTRKASISMRTQQDARRLTHSLELAERSTIAGERRSAWRKNIGKRNVREDRDTACTARSAYGFESRSANDAHLRRLGILGRRL